MACGYICQVKINDEVFQFAGLPAFKSYLATGGLNKLAPNWNQTKVAKAVRKETDELRAKMQDALGEMSDVIGDAFNLKANITGKKHTIHDLLPALSKVLGIAIEMGYVSFTDAVTYSAEAMHNHPLMKDYISKLGPAQWKGAYTSIAEFYDGTDNLDSVYALSTEQVNALTDKKQSIPEPKKFDSDAFAQKLLNGESFKTIIQARKSLSDERIEAGTMAAKQADEAIELAAVIAARQIVAKGMDKEQTFDALVKLADQMPSLNVRTSTSIMEQAYSTPLPLAYVASVRAGVKPGKVVTEPTAGNGALVIDVAPQDAVINELNKDRSEALKQHGFTVTSEDAAKYEFSKESDIVLANPPFGAVKDMDGNSVTFKINDKYSTNEIDHAIALNTLKSLKDDGHAVLIVGGVAKTMSQESKSKAYNSGAKVKFYYTLYNEYNVTDHFTVSGDLYAKQGAAWPVDVIVINGRGKSALSLPAVSIPRMINTIEELKNELQENRSNLQQGQLSVEQDAGTEPAGRDDRDTGDTTAERYGEPVGPGNNEPVLQGLVGQSEKPGSRNDSASNGQQNNDGARPVVVSNSDDKVKNDFQVDYTPSSASTAIGTLIPVNMAEPTRLALATLVEKHGNIDDYVANELDYTPEEIQEYFSAEQVDAIALAISNISSGKGFIIGDMTGIGKGRCCAAMIRYAINNGLTPMFVTEKDNLYGDMIRDLTDIGMPNVNPLVTDFSDGIPIDEESNAWYTENEAAKEQGLPKVPKYGKFLKAPPRLTHLKTMNDSISSKSLEGYDVVFTKYTQMQDSKNPIRMQFLEAISNNSLLILDESHNAGGATIQGKDGKEGRAGFVRKLIANSKGVVYSSATYAKRPDVLDLYSKTDMGMVSDVTKLRDALQAGGVPLQQVVASMLAKAGQYIRREKSFDGIRYDTNLVDVDLDFSEKASEIMRDIVRFDSYKQAAVKRIDQELKAQGKQATSDSSTGGAGAESQNFTSVMHNMISQMLLMLKTQPAIDAAISALERGEKPVITLANTMGSAIDDYAKDVELVAGDAIDLNFGYLLKRYLEKSKRITEKAVFGEKETRILTDDELGPAAVKFYQSILDKIESYNYSKYPVSPIDLIHQKLKDAGYKTGEITGRTSTIDYSGGTAIYKKRSAQATTAAGKRKTINDFNNGVIDVIILNQSGATGLSLHASPKVGTDTRPRHMILAQPELNIDTHMQVLGRINRTGQLETSMPSYSQLVANLPAEKRPAAILAKKMAMLNAQTTAGKDSAVKAKDVPDFMNSYGDEVAAEVMNDNRDLYRKLGSPLSEGPNGFDSTDAIRKVTGRIPILTHAEQEKLYAQIEDAYNDYIDTLTKTGQNNLEASALELDAKVISSKEVVAKIGDSDSPFAAAVMAEMVDIKKVGKPYTFDQVKELLAKHNITDTASKMAFVQRMSDEIKAEKQARQAEIDVMPMDDVREINRKNAAQTILDDKSAKLARMFYRYAPSTPIILISPQGLEYSAYVGQIERKGSAKDYFALGQWKATFYVADVAKTITLPLTKLSVESKVDGLWSLETSTHRDVQDALNDGHSESRENRVILTGNMLAAYSFNTSGQILNYTKDDGTVNQGILMPKKFDLEKALGERPVVMTTPELAEQYMSNGSNQYYALKTSDGLGRIIPSYNNYTFYVPKSISAGGKYHKNGKLVKLAGDFINSGKEMKLVIEKDKLIDALKIIYPISGALEASIKENGRRFYTENGLKFSKKQDDLEFAHEILTELSGYDDMFRFDASNKTTIDGVMLDVNPRSRYIGTEQLHDDYEDFGATEKLMFKNENGYEFYVYVKDNEIWLDISKFKPGQGGNGVYFALGNYAHNTGKVFIGDPNGLSEDAVVRRTSNMLSLALKFGSTEFMYPSKEQIKGNIQEGITPLKWVSDDVANTKALMDTFVTTIEHQMPSIDNVIYDFSKREFTRRDNGAPIQWGIIRAHRETSNLGVKARAGEKTTRRAAFIKSLLSSEAGQRPGIIQQVLRSGANLVKNGQLDNLFSRNKSAADDAHTEASLLESMRNTMDAKFGTGWTDKLLRTDKLKLVSAEDAAILGIDQTAQGVYDPKTGISYLITDNIGKDDDIHALLLHEIAEHALQLGKTSGEYRGILDQIKKMYDAGNKKVEEAFDSVPKDTNPEDVWSEVAAYLVQKNPNLGIVNRIVAWMRNAVRAIGKGNSIFAKSFFNQFGNDLTVDDITYMANVALKNAPNSEFSKTDGDLKYSIKDTAKKVWSDVTTKELIDTPMTSQQYEDMHSTGEFPRESRFDLKEISDKLVTFLADATRQFDNWANEFENGHKLIQAKDLAKNKRAAYEELIMFKFGREVAMSMKGITKKHNVSYRVAKEDLGRWMSARWSIEKNNQLLDQYQQAVDDAQVEFDKAQDAVNSAPAGISREDSQALYDTRTNLQSTLTKAKTTLQKFTDAKNGPVKRIEDQNEEIGLAGGYNDATAKDIMAKNETKYSIAELELVARPIYDMLQFNLENDLKNGKITQEFYDKFKDDRHYVPLTGDPRNDVTEDDFFNSGSLNQAKEKALKGRKGSIAQNGIDAAFEQVERSARYHGWVDFKDALTDIYESGVADIMTSDPSLARNEAERLFAESTGITRKPEDAFTRPGDNVIVVRKNGKAWVYDIHNQVAMNSLRTLNTEDTPTLLQPFAFVTRTMSRLVTQLMPGFAQMNAIRDIMEKSENIRTRVIPGYEQLDMNAIANAALKNAINPHMVRAIAGVMAKDTALQHIVTEKPGVFTDFVNDFVSQGGVSTYGTLLGRDSEQLALQMEKKLGIGREAMEIVSAYNNSFELVSSMSIYKALVEAGVDKKTATASALNLMNFGKAGTGTGLIRALYMFANPTMQGGHQLIKTLNTSRGRKRFIAYTMAGMVVYTMLRALAGDDDELGVNKLDEVGNYNLERNIMIPAGDGTYIKIPVGFGLQQLAWATAINTIKWAYGQQSTADMAAEITKNMFKSVAPISPSEDVISKHPLMFINRTLMPQLLKPIGNVVLNKGAFGQDLANERFQKRGVSPALQGREKTAQTWKDIAEEMTKVGIHMFPEHVKELFDGYLAGPFREAEKLWIENPNKELLGKRTVNQFVDRYVITQNDDELIHKVFYRNFEEIESLANKISTGYEPNKEEQQEYDIYLKTAKRLSSARGKKAAATKAARKGNEEKAASLRKLALQAEMKAQKDMIADLLDVRD